MTYLARTAVLSTLVATLFLTLAHAGRGLASHRGHHGHHHRVYVGVGYYGGWGYPYSYTPYFGPYYSAGYWTPAPVYRKAGYRPASGAVETDVRPKKARVTLNGKSIGEARDFNGPWDLLVLQKGTHTLEFSAPGYMTLRVSLEVKSGGYYHFTEHLVKGDGLDPRSTDPPAIVEEGSTPSARAEIVVEEESPSAPSPALRRGLLHIRVTPADATVYLDGEFLAQGEELARLHGSIPVARGEHLLDVLRPGYRPQTVSVLVEGDEPTRVRVELEAEE